MKTKKECCTGLESKNIVLLIPIVVDSNQFIVVLMRGY